MSVFIREIRLYVSFSLMSLSGFGADLLPSFPSLPFPSLPSFLCVFIYFKGMDGFLSSTVDLSSLCSGV